MSEQPHVVIVGGGFGGLYAARALRREPCRVTLIDRRNHHLFQPLLYQVATAALNPSDIAVPIRHVLRRQRNVEVLLGCVERFDAPAKTLHLRDGAAVAYDALIVAVGATHSYFGNDAWQEHAPGLKSIEDALEIRRRVLLAYEAAERETDPEAQRALLTFAVIGAGPTGVELAGSLAEIARRTLVRDFRRIDPGQARVVLIEGCDTVLPPFDPELRENAARQLQAMGVELRLSSRVTGIDGRGVDLGGDRLACRTVLWAAGVKAPSVLGTLPGARDRAGRVVVEPTLALADHAEVFVIGDAARITDADGVSVPGTAPAAIQSGEHAARNVQRLLRGEAGEPFRYRDKGSLATIGKAAAVAHIGSWKLAGMVAWLAWLFVHVFFLIGFGNRVLVVLQWAWSYATDRRGARLITGPIGEIRGGGRVDRTAAE